MINYHTYHNSQLSILNSQLNKLQFTSCRGKLRRLWRLAVATQPPIADCLLKGHVSIRHPLQASEVVQLTVGVRDGDYFYKGAE